MKGWLGLKQTEHERVASLLSAYMDGRADAHEWELVEKHLRACAACQDDLATLRATVQVVRALPAMRLPRSFVLPRAMARQPRPTWAFPVFRTATAVAAALLVIVMLGDLAGLGARMPGSVAMRQVQPAWVAPEPARREAETALATPGVAPVAAALDAALAPTGPAGAPAPGPATEPPPAGMVSGEQGTPAVGRMHAAVPTAPLTAESAPVVGKAGAPEATAVAAMAVTPTPVAQPMVYNVTPSEPDMGEMESAPPLFLRAIEIGLAGLTLLLGAFALVTSGRVRR